MRSWKVGTAGSVQGGEQSSRRQAQCGLWRRAVCMRYVYAHVCACDVCTWCLCECVLMGACAHVCIYVVWYIEVRGQLSGVGSLLLPCEF